MNIHEIQKAAEKHEKSRLKNIAKKIFKIIEDDLRNRIGIKQEWDEVDFHVEKEIRDTNRKNILKILEEEFGNF